MIGESVAITGWTNRAIEPAVAAASLAARERVAQGRSDRVPAAPGPDPSRCLPLAAGCTTRRRPARRADRGGPPTGSSGSGPRSAGSRSRSMTCAAIWMPPMPSVREWWTFITSGAATFGQALQERELPERTVVVEGRHAGVPGEGQHGGHPARLGDASPPEMPGQVEVRVDDPTRRGEPPRGGDELLAKRRGQAGGPLDPLVEDAANPARSRRAPPPRSSSATVDRARAAS